MLARGGTRVPCCAGQLVVDAEGTCDGVSWPLVYLDIVKKFGCYEMDACVGSGTLKAFAILFVIALADYNKCIALGYSLRLSRNTSGNGSTYLVHSILIEFPINVACLSTNTALRWRQLLVVSLLSTGLILSILRTTP